MVVLEFDWLIDFNGGFFFMCFLWSKNGFWGFLILFGIVILSVCAMTLKGPHMAETRMFI